jgi:hypothetical protein
MRAHRGSPLRQPFVRPAAWGDLRGFFLWVMTHPKICRAARRRACRNSKCEGYNHNIERPPDHYKGHLYGGLSLSARPHAPAARVLSRGPTGEASLQRGPISELPGMCREDCLFTRCRHGVKPLKRLERAKGIEPSYAAWEAAVLPLNYARQSNSTLHKESKYVCCPEPIALQSSRLIARAASRRFIRKITFSIGKAVK